MGFSKWKQAKGRPNPERRQRTLAKTAARRSPRISPNHPPPPSSLFAAGAGRAAKSAGQVLAARAPSHTVRLQQTGPGRGGESAVRQGCPRRARPWRRRGLIARSRLRQGAPPHRRALLRRRRRRLWGGRAQARGGARRAGAGNARPRWSPARPRGAAGRGWGRARLARGAPPSR